MTMQISEMQTSSDFSTGRCPVGCPHKGPFRGSKREETRISCLTCCNSDRTERMLLIVIGNTHDPHAFNGKTEQELGLDYDSNKKAWMTRQLFFAWLNHLDSYVGRTPARKYLLLVDSFSIYGNKVALPRLYNLPVKFLTYNSTNKVQPLNAGIIAWVKNTFCRRSLFRVFDSLDNGKNSLYNINILTAIGWTAEEWEGCPRDFI